MARLYPALAILMVASCAGPSARSLDELVVQDQSYLDPDTMTPYSGPVFRTFPGQDEGVQLRATLRDGTWEGDLTVYHPTGRVRFQGEMSDGAQCGGWIEDDRPTAPESLYEEIKQDLESLVMYPACPD